MPVQEASYGIDVSTLQAIFDDSVRRYIEQRHRKVAPFCKRNFSVRGSWRINRHALGHDLWRAPANVLWAIPYFVGRATAGVAKRLGWRRGSAWLESLPAGFETNVAREIEWLVYAELLELPFIQGGRRNDRDALLETILAHEAVAAMLLPELAELHRLGQGTNVRARLASFLRTYSSSRTAASEFAASLLNLAAGAAAFHKFTPGVVAMGTAAASAIAQELAISGFALGPGLGGLYYGLFPATASAGLIAGAVASIMALLGVLTALTGFVTDPLQHALGFHARRLRRLIDALEKQLSGTEPDFRLRDAYVARIFDLMDLLRGAVRVLRTQ